LNLKVSNKRERGFTLLEMMVATAILLVGAVGVLSLFGYSVMQSSTQGDRVTRTTEYAQDKMEQLMALSFSDTTMDVTQYPPVAGTCCGLAAGGSVDPSSLATGYVDYISGTDEMPHSTSTGAVYIRMWKIVNDANSPTQIKTITVMVQQLHVVKGAITPSTMLVSQKCSTDN
jgi:prepilin-type N-terminal cleavage/methylation domain-containing protein